MMHLILVIAVVFVFAASCLMTFALCRAATRRDMLEARWREESAGSVSEESHESAGVMAASRPMGSLRACWRPARRTAATTSTCR